MTRFDAPSYDVQRPTGRCAITGRLLEPGEPYVATLVECDAQPDEANADRPQSAAQSLGLRRVDVSLQAWQQGGRPEKLFSFWRSTVPYPDQKKRLLVDDEVLLNLFMRLEDDDQPQRLAFRFVLALILMRKRLLRYDRTEKRTGVDGRAAEWWIMTPRGRAATASDSDAGQIESTAVFDPHLDQQNVQQVTDQLSEILEAEL